MASTATIDTTPKWLNASDRLHTFWDLRPGEYGTPPAPGVAEFNDYRVIPRQAGANQSVDVGATGAGLMIAWVAGLSRGGQGLYEVSSIDSANPTASAYIPQLNVDISANASGNPRIDQVILEVLDAQHDGGASNLARVRVVAGTPTAGATLDNRNGAATISGTSWILLADVLAANGFASISSSDIRDRRAFPLPGTIPPLLTDVDLVTFQSAPSLRTVGLTNDPGSGNTSHGGRQAAALMYLPRRIEAATRIRWRYQQGGTPNTATYNIGVYDASGRKIVETGAVALTGAAYTSQQRSETIAATTFEAGWYYVAFGIATGAANSSTFYAGCEMNVRADGSGVHSPCHAPNVALFSASGGSTLPVTLLGLTDLVTQATLTNAPSVPLIALSVG